MATQEFEELVIKATFDKNNATRGIGSLTKSLNRLQNVANSVSPTINNSFKKISSAINNIHIDKKVVNDLNKVSKALKEISKANIDKTLKQTSKLQSELDKGQYDTVETNLKNKSTADKILGNIAEYNKQLVSIPIEVDNSKLNSQISNTQDQQPAIKIDVDSSTAEQKFKELKTSYDDFVYQIEQGREKLRKAEKKYSNTSEFQNGKSILNSSELSNNQVLLGAGIEKLQSALKSGNYEEFEKTLEQLSPILQSVDNQVQKLNKDLDNIGEGTKTASTAIEKMKNRLKSLSFYRLFRMVFQYIINMAKQGLENIAQVDDGVNETMSNLKNGLNQVQNSLGATVGYLLELIEPLLTETLDGISDLLNYLAQFFSAMNGNTTYKKAIKTQEDYAEALEKTKAAATGIDELNVIGDTETPVEDLYEEVDIEESILAMGQSLGMVVSVLEEIIVLFDDILLMLTGLEDFNGSSFKKWWSDLVSIFNGEDFGGWKWLTQGQGLLFTADFEWVETLRNMWNSIFEKETWEDWLTTLEFHFKLFYEEIIDLWNQLCEWCSNIWSSFTETFKNAWNSVVNWFKSVGQSISDWWSGFWQGCKNVFASFCNFFIDCWNSVVGWFENVVNTIIRGINKAFGWLGVNISEVDWSGAQAEYVSFASGGFVDEGQMFIAREAGPELVGTIGGSTAVANNDQIVEGIKQGVIEAMQESRANSETNVKVYLDSQEIASKIKTEHAGASIYKGGV